MLLLPLRENVTGLPLVDTIGPMLGGALVGSVPSMVYQNTTLVVMSLTVNMRGVVSGNDWIANLKQELGCDNRAASSRADIHRFDHQVRHGRHRQRLRSTSDHPDKIGGVLPFVALGMDESVV